LVPGAAVPPEDLAESAFGAGVAAGVDVELDGAGVAASCELDEELELPHAASAAARAAVARTTPALLLKCNQPV
jgi:hypothetical protein